MSDPHPISIWQPRLENEELLFIRPEPGPLGDHYAARPVIHAMKPAGALRVCFFGESAAAGYLYAPHLTPAGVLSTYLNVAANQPYEVIDLARTNETLSGLLQTVEAARQLDPDVLVIFAGNNWNLLETPAVSPYHPDPDARRQVAGYLKDGGVMGLIEAAARQRLEKSAAALNRLGQIATEMHVPAILVVPAVNLADWETRQAVTWLPGDGSQEWYALLAETGQAAGQEDWPKVRQAATRMLDLDGGTCPTPFRLLAQAWMAQARPEQAVAAAAAEIDINSYATLCFLSAPQATRQDQEIIRRFAARPPFRLVDLPQLFTTYTGSPLTGRRLFLDYCHLTREGIQVTMAAVAEQVLRSTRPDSALTWPEIMATRPHPEIAPHHEATAQFGATIHTAHRLLSVGDSAPLLTHWLQAALETDPGIVAAMLDYAAARLAPLPAVLTAEQTRILASPYRLQYQHGWQYPYPDWPLLQALERLLLAGSPAHQQLRAIFQAAIPKPGRSLNLLSTPWEPLALPYPDVLPSADLPGRATYRVPWPESSFGFLAAGDAPLGLEIVLRLPLAPGHEMRRPGRVPLTLNGQSTGQFLATSGWTRHSIILPAGQLKSGINRLTLHWPRPEGDGAVAMETIIQRLETGREADLHPIFGEIFNLQLTF